MRSLTCSLAAARRISPARCFSTTCTSPDTLSTVHRGTAFEERSLKILQDNMSMSLRRVGGKSDGGIDLLGWWWLPKADPLASASAPESSRQRQRFRVLAQCKAEKKKASPKYVREMEGVLHRYLSLSDRRPPAASPDAHATPSANPNSAVHPSQYPLVALLISESPFTKSTVLRAQSSPVPFFLLYIPPVVETSDCTAAGAQHDRVGAAVWNPALGGAKGLLGGQMEARWERSSDGGGRPGLWWGGKKLGSWTPESGSLLEREELDMGTEDKYFEGLARQ